MYDSNVTDLGFYYCIGDTVENTPEVALCKYNRHNADSDGSKGQIGSSFVSPEISPTEFKYISKHFLPPLVNRARMEHGAWRMV